jgi:hypothetical protein
MREAVKDGRGDRGVIVEDAWPLFVGGVSRASGSSARRASGSGIELVLYFATQAPFSAGIARYRP